MPRDRKTNAFPLAWLSAALTLAAAPAAAQAVPPPRAIGMFHETQGGQPILAPQEPLQVAATETAIPPGGKVVRHRHPHQRLVYVLEGRIRLDNLETGTSQEFSAGDLIVEPRGQWHEGQVLSEGPVRLLAIDLTPQGEGNVERGRSSP
ncbi:MAG: cupin domain-containing protein [Phenylobacterium sp.]|jgi:quercetin dioxygenase-like cupin family protein|uniref:cupin domain-containing protein n=1 Tax=Phenylobacterium sp. TaxID=1871053 RepID=UPI00391ADE32